MGATPAKPRRLITVAARTVLCLLLLAQLGVLWVLIHESPTRLPTGLVATLAELASGQASFECREATVDRRGRLRLGGVRMQDPRHPDDAVTGDIDVLPDWRSCLRGEARLIGLHIRGRATVGEPGAGARVDDFVLRLAQGSSEDPADLQVALRVGTLSIHAHALAGGPPAGPSGAGSLSPILPEWNRGWATDALRWLRSLDGAVGLSLSPGTAAIEGEFTENPAALSPLPVQVGRGRVAGRLGKSRQAMATLHGVRLGGARVSRAWVRIDDQLGLRLLADGARLEGSGEASLAAAGAWHPGDVTRVHLQAETAASRLEAELELGLGEIRLRDVNARIAAADLGCVAPLAAGARQAGIDLCGTVEVLGAEATWTQGALGLTRGAFAFSASGWGEIRPALVRPEQARPVFQGDWLINPTENRLALTRLDLAGIRGEIRGGLRAGDPFDLRLVSAEGQPVNPSCLNTLLGAWWIELWSRFDLSTHGNRPEADVRVVGCWGQPESIRTTVRARLRRFGFMNARFLEADLWVFADARETQVNVDQLRGELDGRDAGTVKGNLRWDWRRLEHRSEPDILFVGDLDPLCALRLHDPALAARLHDWDFGRANIRVALGPDRPLQVSLHATQPARLGGIPVERYTAEAQLDPMTPGHLLLNVQGGVEGGRVSLKVAGNLTSDNRVELAVEHWSRTGAERLIARLRGAEPPVVRPDNTLLSLRYAGRCDFASPWATEGEGRIQLADPDLKTLRLLGPLSSALDLIGLSFSSYDLDRAEAVFECRQGAARLNPLNLEGEDALVNLRGTLDLQSGALRLKGGLKLKDSGWGPLKILNPNRLIANMISIDVGGNVNKPEVKAKIIDVNIIK